MVRWRGKRLHVLALPNYLETEIAAFAEINNRSFNAELLAALHEKYTGQIGAEARLAVLTSLLRSLEQDGGPDVVNSKTYKVICQVRDSVKDQLASS